MTEERNMPLAGMTGGQLDVGFHGHAGEEATAFVGRERELRELRQLAPAVRALTLCGAAGIGKTRLAIRLAADLADGFPNGAWFVELADLRQPDLVASRVASLIGVVEEPGRALSATLADALKPRRLLLVLDNCEHLIDACALLCGQLLASSAGLTVIATSREPLRVAAETVWQVPPMSMPAPGQAADADLIGSDALRLFAERAATVRPGFVLGQVNLASAVAICRELDGLPLAIELAAAWTRVLSVEQIAERLADKFRLLSSAERTVSPRHKTLKSAIDWSHDLLSGRERVLLRRLSVFAGWSLEMAEQVCPGPGGGENVTAGEILDLLTGLADKSLVIADASADGQIRYRMLDTIREYAAERLDAAGGTAQVRARFREYAVREVEELARIGMAIVRATWADRVETFRRFAEETSNLRQVLGWCRAGGDAVTGLRICNAMRPVWIVQGSFAEGGKWMDAFFDLATPVPDVVLGPALVGRAQLALATDPAAAGQGAKAGLERCRSEGLDFWTAAALNLLAEVALHAGQLDEADARAAEAQAVASASGDGFNASYGLGTRATVAAFRGSLDEAGKLAEASLVIAREIDQQWAVARTLLGLGDLARLTGNPARARLHYQEALAILREISARPEMARCLAGLGRIEIGLGELPVARQYLSESIELSQFTGSRIGVIRGLECFAELAVASDNAELAVQLAAAAASLRRAASLPEASPGRTRRVMTATAGIDQGVREQLWAAGSALTGEQAVELALSHAEAQEPGEAELTARELEVAAAITRGLSNRAIGDELGIASTTVARHIANIMGKLGVTSRLQIARWAAGRGD
jgi:predicted ATPase/DNA-binding NarL/FixJ family response regulator